MMVNCANCANWAVYEDFEDEYISRHSSKRPSRFGVTGGNKPRTIEFDVRKSRRRTRFDNK